MQTTFTAVVPGLHFLDQADLTGASADEGRTTLGPPLGPAILPPAINEWATKVVRCNCWLAWSRGYEHPATAPPPGQSPFHQGRGQLYKSGWLSEPPVPPNPPPA
jgi:hypothetical protein